ncbi:disease resistance protein RUN1-like [Syzygium oleosum]|uniref:disease resistance protein RUN1-like n=1 Tax=Syzygium oleosum TaxID=219896 RepID=UPI0024B99F6F|nr:disease resistance protein RUN1-like [Syzygium oleosum]
MKRKKDSPDAATTSACVDDGDSLSGAEFEVSLSFRGPDTHLNFTDCLYHSLVGGGIRIFRDDEEIRKGEKIGGELLRAIESSKIYVPIFSRNYASSVWCLRELTHMVECSSKANDKVILPIFCDVNPHDVKLKTRLYLDALEKHEEKFKCDEVLQWKEALTEVARIRGWGTKDKGHGEIIKTIVDEILTKLMKRSRNLPDHLVGIHDRVEAIMDMLNEGSRDVRYLIIHGMGGIGKTTLASAVFNQISNQFQGCSFLSDIRESAQHGRIIDLQKQLLSEILQVRSLEIHNYVDVGIKIIRERFRDKKVLLVLDDVDKWDQLSKLAGKSDWFGPGSKIIITTRDINFLPIKEEDEENSFQAHSEEFKIYEMTEMDSFHALQFFSKHAFRKDLPPHDFDDISHKIIIKTGGLPLALEVIGSSLCCKSKNFWIDTLKKLDSVPKQEVFNKLKISYDMLEHRQREIFLDIACFFIGRERLDPYYMWKASNYFPKSELLVLTRMSLIKIVEDDRLWMHDQLRDLGREIVQREDVNFPGKRSRLWESKIAFDVVRMKEGTDKIVALRLTRLYEEYSFTSEDFSKLPNLRYLELEGGNLVGNFKNLLSKLTWLSWYRCPSELNATNLFLEKLTVLKLCNSDITEDWAGWASCLVSKNLKVIEIRFCQSLKRTPDFSKCSNLKRLVINECTNLLVVDGSLSNLENLKLLQIISYDTPKRDGCDLFSVPSVLGSLKSLSMLEIRGMHVRELHHSIGEMTCLEYLSLDTCSLLRTLPDSIGDLKMLRTMSLSETPIKKLPNPIGGLESLLELYLSGTKIRKLPATIGNLKKLRKMSICEAPIKKLPNQIGGLESLLELDLSRTCITELPASIGNLKLLEILCLDFSAIRELPKATWMLENLKVLHASFCENLKGEIPHEIGGLSFLLKLKLTRSKIRRLPTTMNKLSHLQQLHLGQCDELEQLPELPVNLKELNFSSHLLWTALDLSYLTNLVDLHIRGGTPRLSEFKQEAPNIEWIERLSCLERLTLVVRDVTFPPINLATLSLLQILEITCVDPRSLVGIPSGLKGLTLHDVKSPMEKSLFLNLTNLSSLCLHNCRLREVKLDDVLGQQPEKLRRLDLTENAMLERLVISRLEGLQELSVTNCPGLKETQGLEKLKSLEVLHIRGCSSLEWLPNSSQFEKLQRLECPRCPPEKMPDLHFPDPYELFIGGRRISYTFSGLCKVQLCHKHLCDESALD